MKSVKNLLVPAIILIVLIISSIVYFVVDNLKNKEPVDTTGALTDVVYFTPSEVSSLSVYNRDSSHTSVVNCSSDVDGLTNYVYAGDDFDPAASYSQNKLGDYVAILISYNCNAKVSSTGNYSDYGLADPSYKVTINAVNGSVTTVLIGNKTPDEKNCYICVDGSKDIYTVSVLKLVYADYTAIDFWDSRTLNIEYASLKSVHFDRATDGLSVDAEVTMTGSGIANFNFVKPYNHPASSYFGLLIDSVVGLNISEYVEISDNELSTYGLDNPAYHFVLTQNDGNKTEIYFSKNINGYYYGKITGIDSYFLVSTYQLEGLELKETVLLDTYICYCYAKDVSSITCTYGDRSFRFDLNVPEGKSITANDVTVTLDGRNAQISDTFGRSYCSILFESIACIEIGGIDSTTTVNTSAGPVITLSFLDKNYATTTYEFYSRSDDTYYVFKNGEYMCFYVYSREIFNDGGSDTYSYGFWKAYELLNEAISGNINGIYDIPKEV